MRYGSALWDQQTTDLLRRCVRGTYIGSLSLMGDSCFDGFGCIDEIRPDAPARRRHAPQQHRQPQFSSCSADPGESGSAAETNYSIRDTTLAMEAVRRRSQIAREC